MGKGKERPEHTAPPEIFYNDTEAKKYTSNSRMIEIQAKLTDRAMELLNLPEDGVPRLILDVGCGSGLSSEYITGLGHQWVGFDISEHMLNVARDRELEGDLVHNDMGHGLPLRSNTFDGCISISAVQWLCNAEVSSDDPRRRLKRFFNSLYACLTRGARAVLQFYPEGTQQAEMILTAAMRAGFTGGLVVDYPHSTRAKKYYLCLMAGGVAALPQAKGVDGGAEQGGGFNPNEVQMGDRQKVKKRKMDGGGAVGGASKRHPDGKGKDWVQKKKELRKKRGYMDVPHDSKFTGRKRKAYF